MTMITLEKQIAKQSVNDTQNTRSYQNISSFHHYSLSLYVYFRVLYLAHRCATFTGEYSLKWGAEPPFLKSGAARAPPAPPISPPLTMHCTNREKNITMNIM